MEQITCFYCGRKFNEDERSEDYEEDVCPQCIEDQEDEENWFDEEDDYYEDNRGGTGHGDISYSDADSGL